MDTDEDANDRRGRIQTEFLEGYTQHRSLSDAESRAIDLFFPVYHLWLMGYVLEWSTRRDGIHWADEHFLNWHMDWFRRWGSQHASL